LIDQLPSPLATVRSGYPKLLQQGFVVKFTSVWPVSLEHVSGKTFEIEKTNVVPYDVHHIIPGGDYRDVDISNQAGGELLYPTSTKTLYEMTCGFKPANMLCHLYIPAGEYAKRLEAASMVPNVASVTLRYLGAIKPEDSPYDDHTLYIYSVFNLEPLIMRWYVDAGVDFDKCVMGVNVNKCRLKEITPTPEQAARAKEIPYYSEDRWGGTGG
jgi:hypothetical protein